eukprot:4124589-Prymnesium_polylepis.1
MSSAPSAVKEEVPEGEGAAPPAVATDADPVATPASTAVPSSASTAAAAPPFAGGNAPAQAPPPAMSMGNLNPNQQIGLGASAPRLPPGGAPPALGGGLMLQPPTIGGDRAPVMASEPSPLLGQQQGPLGGGLPAGGSSALPGPPQPYRQLKVEDALAYLDKVKMKFDKQPHIYNQVQSTERV